MATLEDLLLEHHDDIDAQAAKILDYFNSSGYSSLSSNALVNAFRSDFCNSNESWSKYLDSGDCALNNQPQIFASGSWSEKLEMPTKTDRKFIKELDVMFIMGFVNSDHGVLVLKKSPDNAFYYIQVQKSSAVSKTFREKLCEERCDTLFLSPMKLTKHVESVIRKSFTKGQIKKNAIDTEHCVINCPVITLKYSFKSNPSSNFNNLNVMMDMAPVFKSRLKLPEVDIPFLTDIQRAKVLSQPVLLVAKSNSDPLQWRASSSLAERQLFYYLKTYATVPGILRFAKQVLAMLIPWKSGIKSYHLKTALLHWLSEEQREHKVDLSFEHINNYVVELFDRVCIYIEKGNMPHFFFRDVNLLANIVFDDVEKMCSLIKDKEKFRQIAHRNLLGLEIMLDHHNDLFEPLPTENPDIPVHVSGTPINALVTSNTSSTSDCKQNHADVLHQDNKKSILVSTRCQQDDDWITVLTNEKQTSSTMKQDDGTFSLQTQNEPVKHITCEMNCNANNNGLSYYILHGNVEMVNKLINQGANANDNFDNEIPLLLAVQTNNINMVKLLLQQAVDVNVCDQNGNSALTLAAAICANVELVLLLISFKANVNHCTNNGVTPLEVACSRGNVSIVEALLQHGANIHLIEALNCTLDGIRANNSDPEGARRDIIELLLKHGADIKDTKQRDTLPLVVAAREGYLSIVKLLLTFGADINCSTEAGRTALGESARCGHGKIVSLLVKNHADMNAPIGFPLMAPLFLAARGGHAEIAKLLIDNGAQLEVRVTNGVTPLIFAAHNCHASTVRMLLEKGASINAKDDQGYTALCKASYQGHIDTVSVLLQFGANVNIGNPLIEAVQKGSYQVTELLLNAGSLVNSVRRHVTALHVASHSGWLELVKLLVERGAEVDSYLDNTTPLHLACFSGHADVAKYLITCGANVNLPRLANKVGSSLISVVGNSLCLAIHGRHLNVVQMLVENCTGIDGQQKIDVNFRASDNTTPLTDAIQHGQREIARVLLEHGADLNQLTPRGLSPLCQAVASWCCDDMVPILLQYNANIEFETKGNLTPLTIAVIEQKPTIVKLLAEHGARVNVPFEVKDKICTPLIWAVYQNYLDIVKELLLHGACVIAKDSSGYTALMHAAEEGYTDVVIVLLETMKHYKSSQVVTDSCNITSDLSISSHLVIDQGNSCKAIMEASNSAGKTALLLAAEAGHSEIVSLLLSSGAIVNVQDQDGCTPLHMAAYGGHQEVVRKLLLSKAEIDKRNNAGATPLRNAASRGFSVIAKLLRDNNADINACDINGRPVLCAALTGGHTNVVECLLDISFPLFIPWLSFANGFLN